MALFYVNIGSLLSTTVSCLWYTIQKEFQNIDTFKTWAMTVITFGDSDEENSKCIHHVLFLQKNFFSHFFKREGG